MGVRSSRVVWSDASCQVSNAWMSNLSAEFIDTASRLFLVTSGDSDAVAVGRDGNFDTEALGGVKEFKTSGKPNGT